MAAAAFAVEVPFFFFGTPSGHDVEFHLYSWLEVLSQWRQGVLYPRWASLAHFGYGEPRFIFYPPASWTLGAILSAIFPWALASDIYIWLVLLMAGASMFFLARRWFGTRDATFAAVLYAVNPYHLVIVYWRSAFAELLASSLLPLLFLLILRIGERRRSVVPLGLLLAASWLVNAPAAVMVHYSLALLLIIVSWRKRSLRILRYGVVAVLLGAALAAFYLLPAIYEQKWADIAQSVSAGSRPADNFIFVNTSDAEHDAFNRVISWVATAEILVTATTCIAASAFRKRSRENWDLLAAWAGACALLMFSVSAPLWNILPKMRFMQFPWRWMLCLGVPFTIFIVAALRNWTARILVYLAMLCLIAVVWKHFQTPWWDTNADLREMRDNVITGVGYAGTDEYTPAGADPSSVDNNAPRIIPQGTPNGGIHILEWSAERKLFSANMNAPGSLILHLFNYPAWLVESNGRRVQSETREGTGQMLIPVEAGENRVQIIFVRTWDRTAGMCISAVCLLLVLFMIKRPRAGPLRS